MKTKISYLLLLLPLLIIPACDSEQKSPVSKKAEPAPAAPAVTEAPATKITEDEVVKAEAEPAQQAAMNGEQVYKKSCVNCHGTGVANAPKLGDVVAWGPRIAKGNEALYNSAIKGVPGTAMMAKGTCGACSDQELKAAVDFMVSGSK
ncbi:MAG: c-type cytochrome [Gammaproteobacteria bacterium]|nr:c-type cytochrome [Gammaproteobacteria bacterium]MCW8924516.1 c-type cytochrome [Gammaproteobacteria bacterium]